MKCDSEILIALTLGDLDETQSKSVEAHARQCHDCGKRLAELRRTVNLLEALPEAESRPVNVAELKSALPRPRSSVERIGAGAGWFSGGRRWGFALATAACFAFLAFLGFQYGVGVRVGDFEIAVGGRNEDAPAPAHPQTQPAAELAWNAAAMQALIREEIRTQVTPAFLQLARAVEDVEGDLVALHNVHSAQRAYDMRQMTQNIRFVANAVEETLGPR